MNRKRIRRHAVEARKALERRIEKAARSVGYEVRRQHFYLPFPEVERLDDAVWDVPDPMRGVDLRTAEGLDFVRTQLAPYLREFRPPFEPGQTGEFFLDNGGYGAVDAELLYAMLRYAKPRRVLEFGSGASSHVIAKARVANTADDAPFAHTIFDPFPFGNDLGPVDGADVRLIRAEDVAASEIQSLEPGDIFFVDTTHAVRTGGDVVRIILELFPVVPVGVWVHVHDVFLPYEYPQEWVVDERRAWAEQYMLQAFLAFNSTYEVVIPAHAISREHPRELADLIPSSSPGRRPGAFWMKRIA